MRSYQEVIDYLRKKQKVARQKKTYLLKRKEKESQLTLKQEERKIMERIFKRWCNSKTWIRIEQLERELLNNREILDIYGKDSQQIREGLNNKQKIEFNDLWKYLGIDDHYEKLYREYKQGAGLKEELNIGIMEESDIKKIKDILWELDEEGDLKVRRKQLAQKIRQEMDGELGVVLISNIKEVVGLGVLLEQMDGQGLIQQKQIVDWLQEGKECREVYIDEKSEQDMLYDQNYVILKDYNKHIYQELLKAINEQYQYDGKYIDKVAVLDSIQTRLWDCMEEMVNQQESLEDVLLRMMGSRYRYLTRDILMGYWNREGGLWPMVDQTVILKDYDLYEEEQKQQQVQEIEMKGWEKYGWDEYDSDEIVGPKKKVVERKKRPVNWKNVTMVQEFDLSRNKEQKRRLIQEYLQQKVDKEQEIERECNTKVVLKQVPKSNKEVRLKEIEQYKKERRQNQKGTEVQEYQFNEEDMKRRDERYRREQEMKQQIDDHQVVFKAGHVAFTSKYEMYDQMVKEREDLRYVNRKKREMELMELQKSTIEKDGLIKRMLEDLDRRESNRQGHLNKERNENKFENAIKFKPIPDYQQQWDQFDRECREKKQEYRQQLESKWENYEGHQFNVSRKQKQGKNMEMERVNEQKRENMVVDKKEERDKIRKQKQNRMENNKKKQVVVKYTQKYQMMVDKKKQEREEKYQKEQMEEREGQFKLFRKIMFAPRVWGSQVQQQHQNKEENNNRVNEMLKYNQREYSKQMEQIMQRVQQRPLLMEQFRVEDVEDEQQNISEIQQQSVQQNQQSNSNNKKEKRQIQQIEEDIEQQVDDNQQQVVDDDQQIQQYSNNDKQQMGIDDDQKQKIEEEAVQRMQILASMSNLEKMDEQQLFEHYEFLRNHGYIDDVEQQEDMDKEEGDYKMQFNNSL